MQWWNDLIAWVNSDAGWRIISGAVIPFVAILVAGLIAAGAARTGARRAIAQQNSERAAASVAAMIHAGRTATRWSSVPDGQRDRADAEFIAADVQLRLLPLNGASAAADWGTHELASMRRDSASFSFQAEQTYVEFRDRLLEWQRHPSRARKLFALDLERFGLEDQSADAQLVEQQRRWAAEEAAAASVVTSPEPAIEEEPAPVRAVPYTATAIAPEIVSEPAPVSSEPVVAEPAIAESRFGTSAVTSESAAAEPPVIEPAVSTSHEDASHESDEHPESPAPEPTTSLPTSPANWSLHAPTTPTFTSPEPTAPLVVSTPHPTEPAELVEPTTSPSPTNPATGPIERRPIENYGE